MSQRFDEHIKTQLGGLEPDVPSYTWDNIIDKRNKKKPVPFWMSLLNNKNVVILLLLMMAGIAVTWLINRTTGTATSSAKNETNSIADKKNIVNDATPVQPVISSVINAGTIQDNTSKTTSNVNSNEASYRSAAIVILKQHTNIKVSTAHSSAIDENEAVKNIAVVDNDITIDEPANTAIALPVTGTLYNRLLTGAEKINGRQKTALNILKRNAPNVTVPKCPIEKDASGNKKYFEVYGAIDHGIQSLKDTGTGSSYLQKRKESTKFSSAFSVGIRYTKVFSSGMSIRAGLNFSQITEKFTLAQGNLVQITYIINANGDTTGSYTTTGTRYKTTFNKYRTIDIPLLVGYEMGNGRFHTNINAGPVINIYSWQKGEVLDATGQPVSITTGKSNTPYGFKTNTGIGFMAAASFYYKLTENLHIMAEPYFRYSFSQMNKTELTIKQKYNTVGLKIGLRLDIP